MKTDNQLLNFQESLYNKLEIFRTTLIEKNIEPKEDVTMKILSRFLYYILVNTEYCSTEELAKDNAIIKFIQDSKFNDLRDIDEKIIKKKIEAFLVTYF